jgi:transcriptional regulator GlxA family with amidase domain
MWQEQRRPVAGILLFDDVEVLDFAGPYEVLSAGGRVDTLTVAVESTVRCAGGLRVLPDYPLAECPPLDLLIVPGGSGAREKRPAQQSALLTFIRDRKEEAATIASVCTGAFLLGRAGLLTGRRATTHSRRLALFREEFPDVDAVAEKIVDGGEVITAGGVSSGIDLALYLIERWFGAEARAASVRSLDGPWR